MEEEVDVEAELPMHKQRPRCSTTFCPPQEPTVVDGLPLPVTLTLPNNVEEVDVEVELPMYEQRPLTSTTDDDDDDDDNDDDDDLLLLLLLLSLY